MDWNKYNENILVTSSVDKSVKVWDIRAPNKELKVNCLLSHHLFGKRINKNKRIRIKDKKKNKNKNNKKH